jgi:hypothetical protein
LLWLDGVLELESVDEELDDWLEAVELDDDDWLDWLE